MPDSNRRNPESQSGAFTASPMTPSCVIPLFDYANRVGEIRTPTTQALILLTLPLVYDPVIPHNPPGGIRTRNLPVLSRTTLPVSLPEEMETTGFEPAA